MKATVEAVREHYDSLSYIYRAFWGDHIHHGLFEHGDESPEQAQEKMLDYCAAQTRVPSGGRVLDVGCGHGGTAIYLASRFGCCVTGLTVSPAQARLAAEKARQSGLVESTDFLVCGAESYAYPASAFDLVWTMESSEHFAEKTGYFRSVVGTLKAGGRLLLAAWTGTMEHPRIRAVADAFLCPELWAAADYARAMENAGLKVRHCEDLTAKVMRTWEICRQRRRSASPLLILAPCHVREFAAGIEIILEAYRSGELGYAVMVGEKPA